MTVNYDADLADDYDFQIDSDGDIKTKDSFETALLMSLFCERRALASEVPDSHRRRGWIGNSPDFENGSKLWLYEQARVTRTTLTAIETAVYNGLQWMVDDKLAVNLEVTAELKNSNITITAIIERPNSKVERRYYELWNNT